MPPGKLRKNYNDANVEQAVKAVKEEGMSLRQASEAFNVPKSTILDNTKKDQLTAIGRPTVLTAREETLILESVQLLTTWGFPLHGDDLRHFVKANLDKKGVKTRFKYNLPTYKWLKPFLNRHKDFTFWKTNPIKRARAQVTRQDIMDFFVDYAQAVEGVPPENIYNYDEMNFRDDPQSKKCLFKKGTKYCEIVKNTSKQAEMAYQ